MNKKQTSKAVATKASSLLKNSSSAKVKSVAASALSQTKTNGKRK